jgi:threonine/homoserine/homoserine lactone efflux protein
MSEIITLASILGALAIGVMSPGPSFVLVARVAVASSRINGLATALGMGVGSVVFAFAALMGLQAVFLAVPALYIMLKILGGLYLCYLGIKIFIAAKLALAMAHIDSKQATTRARSLWLGFATQISNPKTAIVYASVFAAFLPTSFSSSFAVILLCGVFLIEAIWYAIVAVLLSSSKPRAVYVRYKKWLDRTAGAIMLGLGLKLITSVSD